MGIVLHAYYLFEEYSHFVLYCTLQYYEKDADTRIVLYTRTPTYPFHISSTSSVKQKRTQHSITRTDGYFSNKSAHSYQNQRHAMRKRDKLILLINHIYIQSTVDMRSSSVEYITYSIWIPKILVD